jgi:hypothetical protein
MWKSTNAGHPPDVKFLRAAGTVLAALAFAAGAISLIGLTSARDGPRVKIAEATSLERGTEAMFRAVEEKTARRHELSLD